MTSGKLIVKAGTGCVGAIGIEIFEPSDAPKEYILDLQRGGVPESQFTRDDLTEIHSAIGLFLQRTQKRSEPVLTGTPMRGGK